MKSLSKKSHKEETKSEDTKEVTQKRTISDEAAKNSVVKSDIQHRMAGESLSAWKHRVGLSAEKPKKPKAIK